jgi:AcrR family transcriptional regulator
MEKLRKARALGAAEAAQTSKRPRADSVRNRQRVLDAAAEMFAERGLDATLNDVAARAECGIGTVYRHFPNKEALVEALFADRLEEIVALAEEANSMSDPWQGFLFFLERSMELQVLDRGLRGVLLHSEYGRKQVKESRDRIVPEVGRLVERAKAAGRLRADFDQLDVPMLINMIGSVADYAGEIEPGLWRRYLALFVDGLVEARNSTSPIGSPPTVETIDRIMTGPH